MVLVLSTPFRHNSTTQRKQYWKETLIVISRIQLFNVTIIVKNFQNRSPICISPYYEYWIPVSILLNGQVRTLPYPVFFHFIFSVMIFTLNEKFEEYNLCIFLVISWCFVEFKKNPNIIFLRIPFVDIIFTAFLY